MTIPYPSFPPPDGFGPWHRHDPTGYDHSTIPFFMSEMDRVATWLEGDTGPWIDTVGNLYWNEGEETILFFALLESHPHAHFPPTPPVHVDMTGMDECPLWGSF